jgi:hypothetical protein
VTEIEGRPGEVTEALLKPLPRTDHNTTAELYTFADLLAVLGTLSTTGTLSAAMNSGCCTAHERLAAVRDVIVDIFEGAYP